jgi:hypothetical protein
MKINSEVPKQLQNTDVDKIVNAGNALLPLLSKDDKERQKQADVINYLLTANRKKNTSELNQDNVTHADLWNTFADNKNK